MSDDSSAFDPSAFRTLTDVEQARYRLLLAVDAWVGHQTDQTQRAYHAALDALIAAVRAEQPPPHSTGPVGYCAICYHPLDQCSHCDLRTVPR
jgi:hypothetical protein